MVKNTRISVIIPTLNEEALIEALLLQLNELKAHYPIEIIVVDGQSTDRTREIAARYCRNILLTSPGRGGQFNLGARRASGDILWFLHADSQLQSDSFPRLVRLIAAGATGGCFMLKFADERLIYRFIAFGSNLRAKWLNSYYGDQGIFVHRDVFYQLGGFREIPLMEDVEFSRRLRKKARVQVVDAYLVTSPRRFRKGVLRTLLLMQALKLAFLLKADPKILAGIYGLGRE